RMQAQHVAEELFDARFAAVYSSDLSRASETARPIAEAHGLAVVTDPAWREVDQGEWEGLGNDEIERRWPELWDSELRWSRARPGGEAPQAVLERTLLALARIAERHPGEHVVVVSHGGVIRWLTAHATGLSIEQAGGVRGIGNGGVLEMDVWVADGEVRFGDLVRMDGRDTSYGDPNA
ncbi:MAG: histidine phosphatase family protein, partial [Actinomycetota bacterium]